MKSSRCLLSSLLRVVLFVFSCLLGCAWSVARPSPSDMSSAAQSLGEVPPGSSTRITIPGPLRSFLRMAAISQKVSPEEVLPLLARNVVVNGFQGGGGKPTEFLILLNW